MADEPSNHAEKEGPFLVTAADAGSTVLSSVADGQVCPLASDLGVQVGDVVEGALAPEGPLGVTWRAVEVIERWTPQIEAVDEPPGERARAAAESIDVDGIARVPTDSGELHVLVVGPDRTEETVRDVLADETTRRIAARLGARRVEVRSGAGIVGVRYRD